MAIAEATKEEVQAARDEVFKAALMLQFYVQGEPEQAGAVDDVDAQLGAAEDALADVAAAAGED